MPKSPKPAGYVFPSRRPDAIHPCVAKGMTRIGMWIDPERKSRIAQYCKMKGISMTDFFIRSANKELNQHFDATYAQWNHKRRHIRRGKAYRYLLNRRRHTDHGYAYEARRQEPVIEVE